GSPSANDGNVTPVNGTDAFTYTVTDSLGNTNTSTITIAIKDDVPTANADSGTVTEGALLTVNAPNDVLHNDISGADGFVAGSTIVGVAATSSTQSPVSGNVDTDLSGSHGTLHLYADGHYTYQSFANNISANTTDTFVYTVKDGDGDL